MATSASERYRVSIDGVLMRKMDVWSRLWRLFRLELQSSSRGGSRVFSRKEEPPRKMLRSKSDPLAAVESLFHLSHFTYAQEVGRDDDLLTVFIV
jgi:hypothetical protein